MEYINIEKTLPYELFIRTIKDLPLQDIISACNVNKVTQGYYKKPTFWQDLIRLTF